MKAPVHPPAPNFTDPRDIAWFTAHPDRRQRARAPFPEEIARARLLGVLTPLLPGQEYGVIVTDLGSHRMSQLVSVRLDRPGIFPDSDDDIDRGFRPKTPKGVPA